MYFVVQIVVFFNRITNRRCKYKATTEECSVWKARGKGGGAKIGLELSSCYLPLRLMGLFKEESERI